LGPANRPLGRLPALAFYVGRFARRLTFRRIVDGGDRVEELGDHEFVDVWTVEGQRTPTWV
jgi:hypothetical protein